MTSAPFISPGQVRLLQIARRAVGIDEPRYRILLHNVAGVESTKQLDNQGFEEVMAVLEDMGFTDRVHGAGYWSRAGTRRMAWKVRQLCEDGQRRGVMRYPLPALVERISQGETDRLERLGPRQLWSLIEALKDILAREVQRAAMPAPLLPPEPKSPPHAAGVRPAPRTRSRAPARVYTPNPAHAPVTAEEVPF